MTLDVTREAFLRELSSRHDGLVVWKHLDRALRGRGDIDAAAPRDAVASVAADARAIAPTVLGASHVIDCRHVADKRLLFFVQPALLPQLFELDICLQPCRGLAPWAGPRAMRRLASVRPDGIRSLRAGAEAVVSLIYHGISRSGRNRLTGDERMIVDRGIATDLDGVHLACDVMAPLPARRPLHHLVDDLAGHGWSARHSAWVYAAFVGSAAGHPGFLARRTLFRARLAAGHECVMSRIARHHGRRVPASGLDRLLRDARHGGHQIVEL